MPRPTEISINADALRHNYLCAKRLSNGAKVFAVVKANAYGHGALEVARALPAADGFAVAMTEEAVRLCDAGVKKKLLVLEGPIDRRDLEEISKIGASTVVHSKEQLHWIEESSLDRALNVWIKIDTGMSRLGFSVDAVDEVVERCQCSNNVRSVSLMTHLACADDPEHALNALQQSTFAKVASRYRLPASVANSAALIGGIAAPGDWVRPGLMLYGASPMARQSAMEIGLKPVMTLKSEIIAIRALEAEECVGYGATWRASRPSRIATVAIGYADGYPRHAASGAPVLVDGLRANLVGPASMDMLSVDVTDIPSARIGSSVTLWGEGLRIDEVARHARTISHELMCGVSPRVQRKQRKGRRRAD